MGKYLFLFIVGGIALAGYLTRPTQVDFRQELQTRHEAMVPAQNEILRSRMHNDNVLDRMVATATPDELLQQTEYKDFYVFTIFVTRYTDPMGVQDVRTFGFFQSFLPFKKPG